MIIWCHFLSWPYTPELTNIKSQQCINNFHNFSQSCASPKVVPGTSCSTTMRASNNHSSLNNSHSLHADISPKNYFLASLPSWNSELFAISIIIFNNQAYSSRYFPACFDYIMLQLAPNNATYITLFASNNHALLIL